MYNMMFDDEEKRIRFGDYEKNVNFDKYDHLSEAVQYLFNKIQDYPTHLAADVGAAEHPYFDTICYTNYSDFLCMRPLQPDLSHIQTQEALIYGSNDFSVDYFNIYANRLVKENFNKYKTKNCINHKFNALVCFVGQNKNDIMCYNKLKYIYKEYGKLAIYKPHPLTESSFLQTFHDNIHRKITLASKDHDVYEYLKNVDIVYTTHWSETAFHAVCLGKKIDPIDTFQSRFFGSFSHINTHLFETNKPKYIINKLLNDYRSGLVNPKYHIDWKERIDLYLDYIHQKRSEWRFKYV